MSDSRATDVVPFVRGSNYEMAESTQIFSETMTHKEYNAECASGFYLFKDEAMARAYAYRAARKHGGAPYLTYYKVELARLKSKVDHVCMTELDALSIRYVADNLHEMFPFWCEYHNYEGEGVRPQDKCFECDRRDCERSYGYIETFLSDCVFVKFDDLLLDVVGGWKTEDQAAEEIQAELAKCGLDSPPIQALFRAETADYVHFWKSERLPVVDEDTESKHD